MTLNGQTFELKESYVENVIEDFRRGLDEQNQDYPTYVISVTSGQKFDLLNPKEKCDNDTNPVTQSGRKNFLKRTTKTESS